MKKIIAAALSVLVGAFGYTIVDSVIEDRVATLESEVVELREVISDYHNYIPESITVDDSKVTIPTPSRKPITTKIPTTTRKPITTKIPTTKATTTQLPITTALDIPEIPDDMSFAGLSAIGYNVFGTKDYAFWDDKDPDRIGQKYSDFKYSPDLTVETKEIDFVYDSKQYRFLLTKGEYLPGDMDLIGGETCIFTRPENSPDSQYCGASEDDWLSMEMTVYWTETDNGKYIPQLTRNYDRHWYCNGFVDGTLKNGDTSAIQILCRITFETVEQTNAFEKAMVADGFSEVKNFSPYKADTYKRYGKDIIFVW